MCLLSSVLIEIKQFLISVNLNSTSYGYNLLYIFQHPEPHLTTNTPTTTPHYLTLPTPFLYLNVQEIRKYSESKQTN